MPEDFYKVGPADKRQFDDVGLGALQNDWAAWRRQVRDYANVLYGETSAFSTDTPSARSAEVLAFGIHVEETRTTVPS